MASTAAADGAAVAVTGELQPLAKDQGVGDLSVLRLILVRLAFNFKLTCSLSGVLRCLAMRNLLQTDVQAYECQHH